MYQVEHCVTLRERRLLGLLRMYAGFGSDFYTTENTVSLILNAISFRDLYRSPSIIRTVP